MNPTAAALFLLVCASAAFGQVSLGTLVLKPKEVYELKNSDILVVLSLIHI